MRPRSNRTTSASRLMLGAVIALLAWLACLGWLAHGAAAAECPSASDPAAFSPDQLRALSEQEQSFGPRPTASPSHAAFVDWLDQSLEQVAGMSVQSLPYETDRWDSRPGSLSAGGQDVPLAGAIPFTASTGSGVNAPMVYLSADQPITAANSAGKIVVRDLPWLSAPWILFYPPVLGWSMYDPGLTINPLDSKAAELVGQSQTDLEAAGDAGARGVIEISRLPRSQLAGTYAPYEGVRFRLPGAYLGADEGAQLKAAIAAGGGQIGGSFVQHASSTPAQTRTLLATLPGQSPQKIVLDSHTDGMSAVWEAGPVVMLQMARYLASLPIECRPRTIQFAFVTGHLHQVLESHGEPNAGVRDGGAGQLAIQLDREYDQGLVSGVVVVEHLGIRQYDAVPREGRPGVELKPTDLPEPLFVPVSDSWRLRSMVSQEVREHDLRRTAVLTGVDLIDPTRAPRHCTFGGEGTPYNLHLIPTVSAFALPLTLFSPAFGTEALDFELMQRQSLAFTDVVRRMGGMSQDAIAGQTTLERLQRSLGWPGCPPVASVKDGGPGLFDASLDDPGANSANVTAAPGPSVRIRRGPAKRTPRRKARFVFGANQPGAKFYCALDQQPFAPCTSPVTVNVRKGRRHKFRVVAAGAAGAFGAVVVRRWILSRDGRGVIPPQPGID